MISVRYVQKVFPNGHEALKHVSFDVIPGEFVCIIGRSGAGKSTLLRCLNGTIPVTSGSIEVNGIDVTKVRGREKRHLVRRIGFIYQEFNLIERMSVINNVLVGRLGYNNAFTSCLRLFSTADRQLALHNLERVHLLQRAGQRADSLSGGEKQRVSVARALTQEPLVMLADEPVASLDPELSQAVMGDLHRTAKEDGVPVLVNIHDVHLARQFADRVIGIAHGEILYDGPITGLTEDRLRRIYQRPVWAGGALSGDVNLAEEDHLIEEMVVPVAANAPETRDALDSVREHDRNKVVA